MVRRERNTTRGGRKGVGLTPASSRFPPLHARCLLRGNNKISVFIVSRHIPASMAISRPPLSYSTIDSPHRACILFVTMRQGPVIPVRYPRVIQYRCILDRIHWEKLGNNAMQNAQNGYSRFESKGSSVNVDSLVINVSSN